MRGFRIGAFGKLGVAAYLAVSTLLFPAVSSAPSVIEHSGRVTVATSRGFKAASVVQSAWASTNWSGYAESGAYTGISSTWTVPTVSASSSSTYSSAWIGIDGFNDSNLIQVGTEQDFSGSGRYYAWWEVLPAPQTQVPPSKYPVSPGDRMSAEIYKTTSFVGSNPQCVIVIADSTKRWSFSTTQAYSGPGRSAEWIMEAPEVDGKVSALAKYAVTAPAGKADFDNTAVSASLGRVGVPPSFASAHLVYSHDAGYMVQNHALVSTPGSPDRALTGFDIAYGSNPVPVPAG